MSSSDAERNRAAWDRLSDEYQERHGEFIGRTEPRWGMWQVPESKLRILGDVADKDVLELGCGAAQWSILLAQRGARAVGLDNSARQFEHARRLIAEAGVDVQLVHAAAEEVPLADLSFDIVFCDHGAMTFADPYATVPECARLLRPGGLLAFSIYSPFVPMCWSGVEGDLVLPVLQHDYFGLHRNDDEDGSVAFQIPYGEWIRLFRRHGLTVEDLVEPRPAADAVSTYWQPEELEWARKWPSESIWRVRKR